MQRLRCDDAAWLAGFAADARDVLDALLEKYAAHGIGQLDDLRVLESPLISERGTPVEIAARFGTSAEMRDAISELGRQLAAQKHHADRGNWVRVERVVYRLPEWPSVRTTISCGGPSGRRRVRRSHMIPRRASTTWATSTLPMSTSPCHAVFAALHQG